MTSRARFPLLAAGFFGLMGVTLGALGAHAMATTLAERGMTNAWDTASRYLLFHAVAIFAAAVWLRVSPGRAAGRLVWATRCWSAGILLFSGSLYGLAAGGPRWLGPVTPFGGIALMVGWILILATAFTDEE